MAVQAEKLMSFPAPNSARIRLELDAQLSNRLIDLQTFDAVGSTNDELMGAPLPEAGYYRMVVADHQTAGRGRAGKPWLLPPGAGLCLSLMTTLALGADRIAPLTLAVGVALARGLRGLGADVRVKWPNDLILGDAKLGGILVERRDHPAGSTVVIGVGINIALPAGFGDEWAQYSVLPPTDLRAGLAKAVDRDHLAAIVANGIALACRDFARKGPFSYADDWPQLDYLVGKSVVVDGGREAINGVADGITEFGELRIMTGSGVATSSTGSVRIV